MKPYNIPYKEDTQIIFTIKEQNLTIQENVGSSVIQQYNILTFKMYQITGGNKQQFILEAPPE